MGAGGILGDLEREKKMRRCGGELVSLRGSHLTPPHKSLAFTGTTPPTASQGDVYGDEKSAAAWWTYVFLL